MAPSATPVDEDFRFGERVTRVLPIQKLSTAQSFESIKQLWQACLENNDTEVSYMLEAAEALRSSDIPVGFPTETVYGLGADATRSAAVRGIYKAKRRPLDNPLIVHFSSLSMLYRYLRPVDARDGADYDAETDIIPQIYQPLIQRFWPGPLTILLPNSSPSPFAPEVTTSLPTFGARMPSSPLARLLIELAQKPLAAPSANASGLPSPTTAQHVESDLSGRIEIILDGGPCGVGLESTVVDGLNSPPAILRPGGIGIDEIKSVPGWENTRRGYKDIKGDGAEAPRAPGMKYRHYAPRARCILLEDEDLMEADIQKYLGNIVTRNIEKTCIGVVRTRHWKHGSGLSVRQSTGNGLAHQESLKDCNSNLALSPFAPVLGQYWLARTDGTVQEELPISIWDVDLGPDLHNIAKGLFSALRSLDERGVSHIFIEGIPDSEGGLAAAIMNRLRKACDGG